ncbi:MAG TPA: hypothetical protein VHP58_02105 [Alphaproteobacteria bacterium]|nr:hypothetical protein [Alphaproteobacteria bacterium]
MSNATENKAKTLILTTGVSFGKGLLNDVEAVFPARRHQLQMAAELREALITIEDVVGHVAKLVAEWPEGVQELLLPDGHSPYLEAMLAGVLKPYGVAVYSPVVDANRKVVEMQGFETEMAEEAAPEKPPAHLKVVAGRDLAG